MAIKNCSKFTCSSVTKNAVCFSIFIAVLQYVIKAFFFTKNKTKFTGYTADESPRTFLKAQDAFGFISKPDGSEQ